nr:RNA dependent RNA polymerase [Miscanthus necrotic spot virus]
MQGIKPNIAHSLTGYNFEGFQASLEKLHQHHTQRVNREEEIILVDQFALDELNDLYPQLYNQTIKGWARSFYVRSKHLETLMSYSSHNYPISTVNLEAWKHAVRRTRDGLSSLPTVRALSVETQLDQVYYIQSSSAGYGYVGAKGERHGTNHKRAMARAKATLYSAIRREQHGDSIEAVLTESVPDVGYTRTQLVDITEKTKVRSVWGRAFHYILLEGTAARPVIEKIAESSTFIEIGSDPITRVPRLLSEVKNQAEWLISLDWSQFDATVNRFEINAAFNLLKERIWFPDYETEQAFELSRQLFIHKKVAAPDGQIYWSHKGIPSGSYYTSIIGSIVNKLRIEYLWQIRFGRGPKACHTLGDDSIIGDDHLYPPDELAKEASKLGWIVNPNKTQVSKSINDIDFLGRTSRGGLNQRDLKRCLRLLILPEYPVPTGSISAYRAEAIADDSGGVSKVLNDIARRLKRKFGIASDEEVPKELKRYRFM